MSGPFFLAAVVVCAAGIRADAQSSSVSGVVRDSHGTPQVGAVVELLRPDFSVASEVYTDDRGRYRIHSIIPGLYDVKASGTLFLPTLRENLRLLASSKMVVNLTLSTLYEAFRWLPAQPRQADEPKDDWTWTLRLSANRPLLRLLQDGPLVLVTDGDGSAPELKARVTVRGGESGFGDGGIHNDFEMERVPDEDRAMIFRADLTQAQEPALNALVGYEQQLAPGRTFRTIAAIEDRPDIAGGPQAQGLQAVEMRSGETLNFTQSVQAEFGDDAEAIHLGNNLVANHPFASLALRGENASIAYRVSTSPGIQQVEDLDREGTAQPELVETGGRLALEQGLHQEIAVAGGSGALRVQVTAWHEQVDHPVVSGGGTISPADWASGNLLYDASTDLLRASGEGFSGNGMLSEVAERVDGSTWISFDIAVGEALAMASSAPGTETLAQSLAGMKPREAPMYSASVRGLLRRAGTQWRASYRWQPPDTVTPVDAFAAGIPDAYLSFVLRQPIRYHRAFPDGMEALVDVRNLLAEGYRPFVSRDGSTLFFAQSARCVEGGVSFSF